jgi:hypothetical protein
MLAKVTGIFLSMYGLLLFFIACIACIPLLSQAPEASAQNRLSKESVDKAGVYYTSTVTKTTSVSVTTTSVVIAEANPRRRAFVVYNNSANSAYITYGPTSAGSTCTRILATFNQFEMLGPVVYTGQISAIRNSGSGTLTITELE